MKTICGIILSIRIAVFYIPLPLMITANDLSKVPTSSCTILLIVSTIFIVILLIKGYTTSILRYTTIAISSAFLLTNTTCYGTVLATISS